jgi:uncharacterized protein YkwD
VNRRQTRKARLELEALEDRRVLAASISLSPTGGVLTVIGSEYADAARVALSNGQVVATLNYTDASGEAHALEATYALTQVKSIVFKGGTGDDVFINDTALAVTAWGEGGNDYVEGGAGRDKLKGGDGNDTVVGYTGNDYLYGDSGDDVLVGLGGYDYLIGSYGNDSLYGGTGTDTLSGGTGSNVRDQGGNGPLATLVEDFGSDKLKSLLPPPPSNGGSNSTLEQQIIDLVNQERTSRGLAALKVNAALTSAAQHHAANMAKYNTMAHTLPQADLPTVADRLNYYKYKFSWAGENIAWNFGSAQSVMTAWMNSAGHRANILNANFTEIGVGVRYNSRGEAYFCQDFGRPL